MYEIKGKYSTATIMTDEVEIESDVYKQILSLVNNHVFVNDPKIMPDYHYGNGAVIGFTSKLADKVIPNVVGVDINCNMLYLDFLKRLDFTPEQWLAVDRQIRRQIPMAQKHHNSPAIDIEREFPWTIASVSMMRFASKLSKHLGIKYEPRPYDSQYFFNLCGKVKCKPVVAVNSIGSLGGGNHFIEFSESEATGNTGVTIHSGSRNLGARVCNYWQNVAKKNKQKAYTQDFQAKIKAIKDKWPKDQWEKRIEQWRQAKSKLITPTGLEYLEGDDMLGYLRDMHFCGIYSHQNLLTMATIILDTLNLPAKDILMGKNVVHTIHNYIDPEDLIIRKGAVRSKSGERMLIPFNMEDGILICEGKSNADWNESAPHGAGRMFGRKDMKAKKDIIVRDIRQRMNDKGIVVTTLPKDELKEAYKDPSFIEDAIAPTATIVDRLRPMLPIKAKD